MNSKAAALIKSLITASCQSDTDRWRACLAAFLLVRLGDGQLILIAAQAIHRDTDTLYRMAQAVRSYYALRQAIHHTYRINAVTCQAMLNLVRLLRHELTYTHFAVACADFLRGEKDLLETVSELQMAHETGASVRQMAGHSAKTHSIVLPLWTAATIAEYLPRANGARFVVLEGAEWADVERVVVKPEIKR